MQLNNKLGFVLLLVINFTFSQNNETLLTIDNDPVSTSEFLKLYTKNIDLVKDDTQKEIDNYLELFINYKLKLKEAYRLGLHQDANYKREFENYKKQLTKTYMSDNEVTDVLVEEAYNRLGFDIKASHILILNTSEEDTLATYNRLLAFRDVFLKEGFEVAKQKYHDGKSVLVEDLGYFSAFKMVYDFETMAYNTPPGTVSMPFKTQFGYHIIRVEDKRPTRGAVTVAHIMVAEKQADSTVNPEKRINEIFKKLQQGETFEALAKQFSDDKSSAANGGRLNTFKSGQLSSATFENAAFGIENIGEVSLPVKTDYGWHIIKLIDKQPLQDFKTLKPNLELQVKRDDRSKLINSAMAKELSKRYNIIKNQETKAYFSTFINQDFFTNRFSLPQNYNGNHAVITINDTVFTNNQFLQHLKSKQTLYAQKQTPFYTFIDNELQTFYEQSILNFREANLINENDEFADVLQEYRDGLLLFQLMENEIWNKAAKDSAGLASYYATNKLDYLWNERINVTIASTNSQDIAQKLKKLLNDGKNERQILEILNTNDTQNVIFTTGTFDVSDLKLPQNLELKLGLSKVYFHNDAYQLLNITEVLPSKVKTLEEARGLVISDYQTQLENDWINILKERYTIKVDTSVLTKIKSKLKN